MNQTSKPPHVAQIRLYQDWLGEQRGLHFETYAQLWQWSTTGLDAFWQSIWDYFDLQSPMPHSAALAQNVMPGARCHHAVKTALSPRFVPDDILQVAEIPRTLSGKKLLLGQPLEKVLNRGAMANPHCLDWYVAFAQQRLASG